MTSEQIITKLQRKADRIVANVQKRIREKGAYENAGQAEIRKFEDNLPSYLHYSDVCRLRDYINARVDNLTY